MTQQNKLIAALLAVLISTTSHSLDTMDFDSAIDHGFQMKENTGKARDALLKEVQKDLKKQVKKIGVDIIKDNIPGLNTVLTAKKFVDIGLSENPVEKLTEMGIKKITKKVVKAIPLGKYIWGGFMGIVKYAPLISNCFTEELSLFNLNDLSDRENKKKTAS